MAKTIAERNHKKHASGEGFKIFLLFLPYALLFITFILLPIIIAMGLSFTYFDVINTPKFAGLHNYITLLTGDEVFMKYVLPNTVLYAIVVGIGGYILSFLMAWLLAQVTPRIRTVYALAMYTPSMVGQVLITVIWKTIFSGDQTGLANAYLQKFGIIDQPIQWLISSDYFMPIMIFVSLWSSMGIGFLSMLSGILNIDQELYEAAYVDGAGYFTTMVKIIFPMAKPSIVTIILFNFLSFWNEYVISMTLLTDAKLKTLPVGLMNLMAAQKSAVQYGQMYAGLVIVMLPVLILYMCVQKTLTQGMTLGGLKG